jgi:hypothetical protein
MRINAPKDVNVDLNALKFGTLSVSFQQKLRPR